MAHTVRPQELGVGGRTIDLPMFFPSVSSVKTNFPPVDYARFLTTSGSRNFLVSAYDVWHAPSEERESLLELLDYGYETGQLIMLDSGGYESYWMRDATWTREKFRDFLRNSKVHLAFSYDNQSSSVDPDVIAREIEESVLRDQEVLTGGSILPIVHAPSMLLPDTVAQVVSSLKPLIVAVAERDLGDGIIARMSTLSKIRQAIKEEGYYCPIHLLGTGNPLSILLYVACGADSFDGLEWCQTVAIPGTVRLLHFHQYDLLQRTDNRELPYTEQVLLSNLIYYHDLMGDIRKALGEGVLDDLISKCVAAEGISRSAIGSVIIP